MSIYSGTGDNGETSVLKGGRVSKNDALIHFEGTADELNSQLGLVKALIADKDKRDFIEEIQKALVIIMAYVSDSSDEKYFFPKNEITVLEKEIDKLSGNMPKELKFVLPGKSVLEAQIHIARTAARRAERYFTAVVEQYGLCKDALAYLNRLSDYLFVLSQNEQL